MSKQTKAQEYTCAHKRCGRQATIGVFQWANGASDVDLNSMPVSANCGPHKIDFRRAAYRALSLRNVRLDLSLTHTQL